MSVQTEKLRQMLGSFGWELVEARTIRQLWVAELWLLRSTWSPTHCELYLTFEIDPQRPSGDFTKEWFARPSLSRPYDWFVENSCEAHEEISERSPVSFLSTVKDKDLRRLFNALAEMRNKFVSNTH